MCQPVGLGRARRTRRWVWLPPSGDLSVRSRSGESGCRTVLRSSARGARPRCGSALPPDHVGRPEGIRSWRTAPHRRTTAVSARAGRDGRGGPGRRYPHQGATPSPAIKCGLMCPLAGAAGHSGDHGLCGSDHGFRRRFRPKCRCTVHDHRSGPGRSRPRRPVGAGRGRRSRRPGDQRAAQVVLAT